MHKNISYFCDINPRNWIFSLLSIFPYLSNDRNLWSKTPGFPEISSMIWKILGCKILEMAGFIWGYVIGNPHLFCSLSYWIWNTLSLGPYWFQMLCTILKSCENSFLSYFHRIGYWGKLFKRVKRLSQGMKFLPNR